MAKKVTLKIPTEEELEAEANTTATELVSEPVIVEEHVIAEEPKKKRVAKGKKKNEEPTPVNIDEIEGISVGSPRSFNPNRFRRRVTRERQLESIDRRKNMKVIVEGQEQDISAASKYMLDMLISSEEQE